MPEPYWPTGVFFVDTGIRALFGIDLADRCKIDFLKVSTFWRTVLKRPMEGPIRGPSGETYWRALWRALWRPLLEGSGPQAQAWIGPGFERLQARPCCRALLEGPMEGPIGGPY